MAENKPRMHFKPTAMTWIVAALVLVLVVEIAMAGSSILGAMGARGDIDLSYAPAQSRVEGVCLYDLGRDFEVNNEFLMRLMKIAKTDSNTVSLSLNIKDRVTFGEQGAQVDGTWLLQTATLMEMVFQSECSVIISLEVIEDERMTADAWAGLWKQVADAFGHRPANELSYALNIVPGRTDESWNAARREVIAAMRAKNAERNIVVSIPDDADAMMMAEGEALCDKYGVQLGVLAADVPGASLLNQLQQIADACNTSLVLIEKEDASISDALRDEADRYNAGYLLQGD